MLQRAVCLVIPATRRFCQPHLTVASDLCFRRSALCHRSFSIFSALHSAVPSAEHTTLDIDDVDEEDVDDDVADNKPSGVKETPEDKARRKAAEKERKKAKADVRYQMLQKEQQKRKQEEDEKKRKKEQREQESKKVAAAKVSAKSITERDPYANEGPATLDLAAAFAGKKKAKK
eukprot:TRINITY_DN23675_c0_g1_i1.p2 TRINITY_DN23675_c0_g1~~TRINITY_DN23675_c0_g1_i1.p2  ORF type:complete len:175 (-),score=16.91 TRINITY_DN23675_c0_g1_i1:121-645(-)